MPNLLPNALVPEAWENPATKMLHKNLNAAHHLTGSVVWTNHQKNLKKPQHGSFKGIFSSLLTGGAQMKLMKLKLGLWWNSNIYLKFCPCPAHGKFLSFSCQTRQRYFGIACSRLCTA